MDSTPSKASFSNANRHMQEEEELRLTSVGVDIGSSTTHLVFSRLELHLEGTRYRVTITMKDGWRADGERRSPWSLERAVVQTDRVGARTPSLNARRRRSRRRA